MSETWATLGRDLHLDLTGPRVRAGVEAALRDAVRGGRLLPGTRLPSSRVLATDLGLARNTVADAYSQLVAEGWLASRQGSGTWVAERVMPAEVPRRPDPARLSPVRYDLRSGAPDVTAFPRSAWLGAARRALSAAPPEAFGYTDPRGLPQLRAALADYLSRARGVVAPADRIVICSGFAQGLELICEMLRARGAVTVAHEQFGHSLHRCIAEATGLRLQTVPVDRDGAVIAQLADADAVLLTPAHQFPLGVPLEASRRRQAVAWAARSGGVIVEDDYDGELRYDRPKVGAMQALAPEHVIYAGTASKSLAPGLRLGWLVLPTHLLDDLVRVKASAGRLSSSLDQLTLAEFIVSGAYDRQVRRARLIYKRRRDQLIAVLGQHAPEVRITGIAAGLQALLELPANQGEEDLTARAARHGLAIEGLRAYTAGPSQHGPALIVGYATPPGHAFTAALARLGAVLGTGG